MVDVSLAALLAAMQEGSATLSGNVSNAISEDIKRYAMTRKFKRKVDCNTLQKFVSCHFQGVLSRLKLAFRDFLCEEIQEEISLAAMLRQLS